MMTGDRFRITWQSRSLRRTQRCKFAPLFAGALNEDQLMEGGTVSNNRATRAIVAPAAIILA